MKSEMKSDIIGNTKIKGNDWPCDEVEVLEWEISLYVLFVWDLYKVFSSEAMSLCVLVHIFLNVHFNATSLF